MARKKHLINVHTSTGTTAPTGASLYLGEIAVQHTTNEPALWIKVGTAQTSTEYEKFIGQTEIMNLIEDSKILGSGYTYSGISYVNSSTTIADAYSALTKEMIDNEFVVSTAINSINGRVDDLDERLSELEADSGLTEDVAALSASVISNKNSITTLSGSVIGNKNDIAALSASVIDNKEEISAITIDLTELSGTVLADEYVVAQAFNSLNDRVDAIENNSGLTALSASVVTNKSSVTSLSASVVNNKNDIVALSGAVTSVGYLEEITWSELKSLRDSSGLTPGMQYRITDYNTTTVQSNTQAAGHQFDIIVVADDDYTLNENARAVRHAGDTYFSASTLWAWELKYDLDNDAIKFAWADSGATGRGVIYYMKDEWNNECPYDFKNIMFKRKISLTYGYPRLDLTSGTDTWVFTFAATSHHISDDIWSDLKDGSLESPYGHESDETSTFHDNVMGKYIKLFDEVDEDYTKCGKQYLNDNVFLGYWEEIGSDDPENGPYYFAHCSHRCRFGVNCVENTFGYDCYSNIFGDNCCSNTFGNICSINTFGNNCYFNTFKDNCCFNTFRNNCVSNTFQNDCSFNVFGNNYQHNTFGNYCYNNIFGNTCYSSTFGNNYQHNTFGNNCGFNTLGDGCCSNTFGNNCNFNTFGNDSCSNTFGNDCNKIKFGTASTVKSYCSHNIIENGNKCIYIDVTSTTSLDSPYRNVKIAQGVNNTSTYKTITDSNVNQTYQTVYQPANTQIKSI